MEHKSYFVENPKPRISLRKKTGKSTPVLSTAQRRQVKSMIDKEVEEKYHLQNSTGAEIISSTARNYSLTAIPQGNLDTNREGDALYLKDFDLRMLFTIDSAVTGSTPQFVRVVLYQWKPIIDTAGGFPALSTIFMQDYTGSFGPLSHYNHDTRFQYRILRDTSFVLMPPGEFTTTTEVYNCCTSKMLEWRVKSKFAKKVQYIAGSTTNASNQIFLVVFSNVASASSQAGIGLSALTNFVDS